MKRSLMSLLGMFLVLGAGCATPAPQTEVEQQIELTQRVMDYENGVYYFRYTGREFARALSAYMERHPELELVSMVADGNGTYGRDTGYIVVFRTILDLSDSESKETDPSVISAP